MKRATFAALLGGAAVAPRAARAQTAAPTTIRVGTAPVESYALMFYGIDRGFSKRPGSTCRCRSFRPAAP
jgi:ABC-type nitrate/sulfonate/bicarbonate transport system substrate-binding protein